MVMNLLWCESVYDKIRWVEDTLDIVLALRAADSVPYQPARDIEVVSLSQMPLRQGLSTAEGLRRVLHDLANVELQAIELGVRTLMEYPWAPESFRQELAMIVREETHHLQLCLNEITRRGGFWGEWPVHLSLWQSTCPLDTLAERVFIVHRYLEASGLDSGDLLLKKLSGVPDPGLRALVKRITDDEVQHVAFGSYWCRSLLRTMNIHEDLFFQRMTQKLISERPRPNPISFERRRQALFSSAELTFLQNLKRPTSKY